MESINQSEKKYITAIYTRKAMKRYYEKNRDALIEYRREKHEKLKTDEDYIRKRKEYAKIYYQRKKALKQEKIEMKTEATNEEIFYDCIESK